MKQQERLISDFLGYDPSRVVFGEIPVVVVTADGVTVPLEANTVRSIDSMSVASLSPHDQAIGVLSAEYFLSKGYRVIYIHRKDSAYFPFTKAFRRISGAQRANQPAFIQSFGQVKGELEMSLDSSSIPSYASAYDLIGLESQIMRSVLWEKESSNQADSRLFLPIAYQTIHDYFDLLGFLFRVSELFGPQIFFFLTAKIPPYYIPLEELATHKIQSDDALDLRLRRVKSPIPSYRDQYGKYTFVVDVQSSDRAIDPAELSKPFLRCLKRISTNECHVSILLHSPSPHSGGKAHIIREKNLRNLSYAASDFSDQNSNIGEEKERDGAILSSQSWPVSCYDFSSISSIKDDRGEIAAMLDLVQRIGDQVIEHHVEYAMKNFCCRFKDGKKMTVTGFKLLLQPREGSVALRQDILHYQYLCASSLSRRQNEGVEASSISAVDAEKALVAERRRRFVHRVSLTAGLSLFGLISLAQAYLIGMQA